MDTLGHNVEVEEPVTKPVFDYSEYGDSSLPDEETSWPVVCQDCPWKDWGASREQAEELANRHRNAPVIKL